MMQSNEIFVCEPGLHEYLGGASVMPATPHLVTNEKIPLTNGQEISGIIEEVGKGVRNIKVGARVVVQPLIYEGTCGAIGAGYINCCVKSLYIVLSDKTSSVVLITPPG